MTSMDDLITWLRTQFDADEQVAQEAARGERDPFDGTGIIVMPVHGGTTRSVTLTSAVARHIARWDPARVLAEVEAKRALLEETIRPYLGTETTTGRVALLALRLLAQPYAGRDGWRSEWTA